MSNVDTAQLLSLFYLKLDGALVNAELMGNVQEVTVESSLHLPDVATITILDQELRWMDSNELAPGKKLVVIARAGNKEVTLFDGEVVEIEPRFEQGMKRLLVRAFDRLHRLGRGLHVRRFVQSTDGDVIKKLALEVGLQAKVGQTSEVHPCLIQTNETNLAFLQRRAAALGYLLYVEGETLHCDKPKSNGAPIVLGWEKELQAFYPRMSTLGQLNEVVARGWDPKERREVVGVAKTSAIEPKVGERQKGGEVAQKAFNVLAKQTVVDRPVRTQRYANHLAQATVDRHAGRFIEAEGVCGGEPRVVAGATVQIENVGKRFSGTYFVTSATHTLRPGEYEVRFSVSGLQPATLLSTLLPESEGGVPSGLVVGVVTNNNDDEKLGRVKVKYPWLSAELESDWIRVVGMGAGPDRGICFLPEVNDEVLIGFELGDFDHPYVLGGLWNGKDKLPAPDGAAKLTDNGKVLQRVIRTRAGYELRFDEDDTGNKGYVRLKTRAGRLVTISDSDKGIEIKTEQHSVKLDDQGRLLTLSSEGDLKISAKGKISIEGQTGVEVRSNAALGLQATSTLDLKSNGAATLQANATLDVKSSAILTVQGTLVKIN